MIRQRVRPLPLAGLTLIWIMLWGTPTWSNLVFGLVLGFIVLLLFPLPHRVASVRVHPLALLRLIGHFLVDLFVASWVVAWMAMRPRGIGRGAIMDVQLSLDDDLRRAIVAEMTSLVPGTVVLDLDPFTSIITVHVVDTTDPVELERERGKILALERRVARAIDVVRPAGSSVS